MLAFLLACSPAPVVPPAAAPLELPQGARLLLDTEAVADAFPLGERIIQRTPGGAIVVRSRDRILERTVLGPAPAAAIGPDDTKVLVAWKDGGTATLDPATGALTSGPHLDATPIWIGRAGHPYVVGFGADSRRVAVLDLETGTRGAGTLTVPTATPLGEPSAIQAGVDVPPLPPPKSPANSLLLLTLGGALPPPSREPAPPPSPARTAGPALLLGWDGGEWGGALARVDLTTGTVDATSWSNITGFAATETGVLAFGGMDHMGFTQGWIAPVGGDAAFNSEEAPDGPKAPIHHVIPDRDGYTVLSFSDVFHVDPTFSTWSKRGTFRVTYWTGRPDAVGTYASVVRAWPDGDSLVLATRYDGFLQFTPPDTTTPSAGTPTTGRRVQRLLAADGVIALVDDAPWRWTTTGLEPVAPSQEFATWDTDHGDLRRTRIDGDRVTTTTWHGGTQHDEVETTPAGHHALRDGVGRLLVGDYRGNQRWTPDGWRPLTLPPQESWLFAWRPIPGVAGVFRRSRGAPDAVAHIVGDALVPLPGTIDAAPWDGDVALLTATGVERWSPAEDRRTPVPFAIPASPTVIARDGCGRLWVGGDSVVLEPDQVVTFPGIAGRTWTSAVGLEDGVALTDGYVIAELRRECSP